MVTPVVLYVGFFSLAIAVAVSVWWNAPEQVLKRKLRSVSVTPIGSLRPGDHAKVSGRLVLREALESPLRGVRCAYYALKVEEAAGKNHWRSVLDRWEGVEFFLEDETGRVLVSPGVARLGLEQARTHSGVLDAPDGREAAILERHGLDATGLLGLNRTLRYTETDLHEGERVAVFGLAEVVELDGAPMLTLVPDPEIGLVISDLAGVHA